MCLLSTGQDAGDLFNLNVDFVRGKEGNRLFWAGDRKKTGEPFRTFVNTEATRFLRKYVEIERKDADDGDPLFALDTRTYTRTNPVTKESETVTYGDRINPHAFAMNLRESQRKLGMVEKGKQAPFRAKRFRKLFRTACARAGLDEGYRMCFMGHAGNVSSGYLEKPRAILEAEYVRVEPFLEVMKSTTSEDVDKINLDLKKTKDDLSKTMESLVGQNTRIIKLYERNEEERQRNAALEARIGDMDKTLRDAQDDRARLEGTVTDLSGEVEDFRYILNQMVSKYRILKDIAPETWKEIEKRTGPPKKESPEE